MGKISMSITTSICGNSLMFVRHVNLLCFYIFYQSEGQTLGCMRLWIVTALRSEEEAVKLNWATSPPKPLKFFAYKQAGPQMQSRINKSHNCHPGNESCYRLHNVGCTKILKVTMLARNQSGNFNFHEQLLLLCQKKKKSHSFCCVFC